jgi:hypothetical protein
MRKTTFVCVYVNCASMPAMEGLLSRQCQPTVNGQTQINRRVARSVAAD